MLSIVVCIMSLIIYNLDEKRKGLIVGLGGGGLAMFLHQYFKKVILRYNMKIKKIENKP